MSSKERVNEPPDTFRPVIWVPGVRRQLRILSQPPLSVVSASAMVSDIDSVLNFCFSFVTCLLLFVLLSVAPILPLYQLQIDASCCLLSVADSGSVCFLSLFFSPPPSPFFVFWLGLLSGASWGNAWSLSVGTTIHVCVFLFVSRAFFPHPSPPEFLHASAATFLSEPNVLIKCHS